MQYAKLIDGKVVPAPNPMTHDGFVIYNPTAEQYHAAGYMPVVDTPYPEQIDGDEPVYYAPCWVEMDGQIVKGWEESLWPEPGIVDTNPPIPTLPTLEERVTDCEDALVELAAIIEGEV